MSDAPDEIVKAELADVPLELPQPPLSISHLMLWILGSAIVFGCYRWLELPDQRNAASRMLFQADQLVRGLTVGAGVAALMVYARRIIVRDAPLLRQAGHWLLVVQGLIWPVYFIALLVVYGPRRSSPAGTMDYDNYARYVQVTVFLYLYAAALNAIGLCWLREPRRWRLLFATSAALSLLHAVVWCCAAMGMVATYLALARMVIMLAFIGVCVLGDRRQRLSRDWIHHVGVGFYIFANVGSLLIYSTAVMLPRR